MKAAHLQMSSHIYEDPDLTIKFKYGHRGDGEERLEREVDIYETSDVYTDQKVRSTRRGEVHTQYHLPAARRDRFRVPALILGLLCLLLVAGLTVFYKFYVELQSENQKLTSDLDLERNLQKDLERINCQFGSDNQTQANTTEWKRFECSCYYISTERKNWTESRKDCERRGADLLVIKTKSKHEFFRELSKHGEFWIGLERKGQTKGWSKEQEWEWVDGSPLAHTAWNKDAKLDPEDHVKVFMDLQGTWNYTNTGSKHWICERDIYRESAGHLSV